MPHASLTARHGRRIVALVLGVTVVLALLTALALTAPRTMSMLVGTLVASELSPLVALVALVWTLVAFTLLRGRGSLRMATIALLLAVAVSSLRPLVEFRRAAASARRQLGGDDDPVAFSPLVALTGLPVAHAVTIRAVPYRAADGAPLTLQLYTLGGAAPRPVVVVVYGGAWRGGDATQSANVSRALASRGYAVVAIDYRHAPASHFPAQLDDVRRSLTLVRDSAASWGIDATHLALLGRSSGGQLAELTAFTPDSGGDAVPVRAVIALYAPYDLAEGYRDLPVPDPIGVRHVLRDFLGGPPNEQAARYHDASPASYVRAGVPSVLLLFGGRDHVVKPEFNRGAAAALRGAGARVVAVELPWAEHGFDMVPGGLGAQLALDTMLGFLGQTIGVARG
jgi:acetyl esterase/lipase